MEPTKYRQVTPQHPYFDHPETKEQAHENTYAPVGEDWPLYQIVVKASRDRIGAVIAVARKSSLHI
jgi:hypothetical protein